MKNIRLEILSGLPGSGKTQYARDRQIENPKNICVLSLDNARERLYYKKDLSIRDCVNDCLKTGWKSMYDIIIVDGLLLTNKDIHDCIISVAEHFHNVEVVIHHWDADRETCIKNDGGRREASSVNTILRAIYEEINIEQINQGIEQWGAKIVSVISHKVELKPDWYRYTRPVAYIDKDNKLRSSKWCTGGAYGNCWNDGMSAVSPENPVEFKALDELLEKICPSISFLHYKKIRSSCVGTEESYESDYYGGGVNYLNWVCDLPRLYELLNELGYNINQKVIV